MKKKVNMSLCEKSLQQKLMTNKAVIESFKEKNDNPTILESIYMVDYPITLDKMLEKSKFEIIKKIFQNDDLYKSHDFTLTYKGYWVDCECENDCENHREYRIECNIDMNDIEDEDKN